MKAPKDKQIGVEIKSYKTVAVQILNINHYDIFVRHMKSGVYKIGRSKIKDGIDTIFI